MATIDLWPVNFALWETYMEVGNILQPAGFGAPGLDIAGIIFTLGWLGLEPEGFEERADLLAGLQIIHCERMAAQQPPEDQESGDGETS